MSLVDVPQAAGPVAAWRFGRYPAIALVGDEPVAEGRVVVVDVVGGVDQVRVVPVALAHRMSEPLLVGLRREAQYPAGHRDRDVLGGEFTDQRVDL